MARPLSEEKREAILDAAAKLVAEQGTGAPTSKIAKAAGVAEGTLFTYFASKDDLLNALYLSIKGDMRRLMADDMSRSGEPQAQFRQLWNAMVDWTIDAEVKSKAMRQLTVSNLITDESRAAGSAPFRDIEAIFDKVVSAGALRNEPTAFAGALLQSLADTVAQFIQQAPDQRDHFKQLGFRMFWNAIHAP